MSEKNRPHRNLFLAELMIAILFFALCSVICLQLFSHSRMDSRQMQLENAAASRAESAAGIFQSQGIQGLADALDHSADAGPEQMVVYYDSLWNTTGADTGIYAMSITLSTEDHMESAHISVYDMAEHTSLYELNAAHHIPYTLGDREVYE